MFSMLYFLHILKRLGELGRSLESCYPHTVELEKHRRQVRRAEDET